jgi:hypothetical protein
MHSANASGPEPPALGVAEPEFVAPPRVAGPDSVVVAARVLAPPTVAAV